MLRLLPRPSGASVPSARSSARAAEGLLARLCAEGRLTSAEADVLVRSLPSSARRDRAWAVRANAEIAALDLFPPERIPAHVERRVAALDVPAGVSRSLAALRHHAALRLPDLGTRYQRLRAILVALLAS